MAKVDGGELLMRVFDRAGIRTIFTLHGGHLDAIYQAARERDVRLVDTRHEQAAGHAADGWARTTGQPGVAIVTAGPGVTDCTTAIANAYLDCVPTLFIGGVTGFLLASLLNRFAGVDLPDNRFVLVGMAGTMAAVMHAPLTAIFLIAEITGGYTLLIPLIITSTTAYITIRGFERHSIYHVQLAERGELITHDKDKAVLTMMDWKKEIERDLITVRSSDNLGELVRTIAKSNRNIFPVVDEYNILEGVVLLDDVREIMFNSELYKTIFVKDLVTIPPTYLDVGESIEVVMEAFTKTDAWNLPVLDKGYYVGFVSKSRLYSTYRDLLIQFSEE